MSATNQPNEVRLVQSAALLTLNSLVDKSFGCSICIDSYTDPYAIPACLHRFCGACVKESIQRCGNACPACRARIASRRDLRKDHLLGNIVSEVLAVRLSPCNADFFCITVLLNLCTDDTDFVLQSDGQS